MYILIKGESKYIYYNYIIIIFSKKCSLYQTDNLKIQLGLSLISVHHETARSCLKSATLLFKVSAC